MSEEITRRTTPTAQFRAIMAPYREKLERTDTERAKLEARQRRAFDAFNGAMRDIWGDAAVAASIDVANGTEATPAA